MTDEASIDEQVERAIKTYMTDEYSHIDWNKLHMSRNNKGLTLASVMRDLLAGKFKEAPLPEIIPPPWPHSRVALRGGPGTSLIFHVRADGKDTWGCLMGPNGDTAREAITKWNAVFTKRDER
jgi:hypothetical protein